MPWRYPGITPVTDSCGVAGGILPGQAKGIAGADSHWRDCHFADTPSPSVLKHLLREEGMQQNDKSRRRLGADYTQTPLAKLGDLGSKLPPMPTGTVWTAGGTAEVGWTREFSSAPALHRWWRTLCCAPLSRANLNTRC